MITGGKALVSTPPSFSNDSKKLLVCTGNTVSVFSTATGLLVTELEGHAARVTAVVVVPTEAASAKFVCYCWTSSMDGTICYWDFALPELVRRIDVRFPVFDMVIPNLQNHVLESSKKPSKNYAVISVENTSAPAENQKAMRGRIQIYDLTSSRSIGILTETRKPEHVVLSPSMKYFGIRNKRKIQIWKVPTGKFVLNDVKMIKLHHTKNFDTLAFHPTERIVAGGDSTGRILLCRNFGSKKFFGRKNLDEEEPDAKGHDDMDSCPTTWHWHAREVKFLSFSLDGAYLFSGGKEGVIAVWQLDTGKMTFKPRIGAPLLYFSHSIDPTLACVSCADNQIHLLKMPSMDISKSVSGIKLPISYPDIDGGLSNGFAVGSADGLLALRTENYCVQFFSLFGNSELSQVRICERNYSPVDDITVIVALVSLSVDSSMMATVDVKLPEEEIGGFISLKFWSRGSRAGEYMLSTVIHEPHSDAGISAIVFSPDNTMAASSSYGGDFKIWENTSNAKKGPNEKGGWRCRSIGSYKKKPMRAAAFSNDGSVLAVAAETIITLWNPKNNVLIAILGETAMPIAKLSFVGNSGYLATTSHGAKPQLAVWNLSNLSVFWSYKLHGESLSCSNDGSLFAVLVLWHRSSTNFTSEEQDGFILIFDVENPVPIATWLVKKAKGAEISFIQATKEHIEELGTKKQATRAVLVYINGDHEYIIFDPYNSEECPIDIKVRKTHVPGEESDNTYGYASIYGELPEFNLKREQTLELPFSSTERPWETIFSGSSHALPPLSKLCSTFFESLLEKIPRSVK